MSRIVMLLVLVMTAVAFAADAPQGYKSVFEESFDSADAIHRFVFTDPTAWKHDKESDNGYMELFGKSKYEPAVRSPFNIALIDKVKVADFVLDIDLRQTGKEYGHRDMCLFFNFQDPAHFYYVHIATKRDPHAHNIFIVNSAPRLAITKTGTEGFDWGHDAWHHMRLVRDAKTGRIAVYADDMEKPIMEAEDKTFDAGYVGVGSFDDTGRVDNIKLLAPSSESTPIEFFKHAD
ncbi:MAG: hypothetical protein GC162_05545 [Planctomycetes bacterium]|nr:hypothetical protein [Planctomycetota bacterium]